MRKSISVILALSLVLTSIAVCFLVTAADVEDTFIDFELDFEREYKTASGGLYYNADDGTNWSNYSVRASEASIVNDGNGKAVRLTYGTGRAVNYQDSPAMSIYNPLTSARFKGESGVNYAISIKYKIEDTDGGNSIQLLLAHCNRTQTNNTWSATDFNTTTGALATSTVNYTAFNEITTAETDGYVKATVVYTANGTYYPIIILRTNDGKKVENHDDSNFASVLIDDISVKKLDANNFTLDFEEEYKTASDNLYYDASKGINWSNYSVNGVQRDCLAEIAVENNNRAVRFTYRDTTRKKNYNDNAAMTIFNPVTKSRFIGENGKKYFITVNYKVENTDSQTMQLYLATCTRTQTDNTWSATNFDVTKMNAVKLGKQIEADEVINGQYVTATASFTADGINYPIILLSTNESKTVEHSGEGYASILIDDISVKEDKEVNVMFYDYDGTDKELTVKLSDTFAHLIPPTRKGYLFGGWYKDAEFTQKAGDDEYICNAGDVYVKWLGDGNVIAPEEINDCFNIFAGKSITQIKTDFTKLKLLQNSLIEQPATNLLTYVDANGKTQIQNFYGSFVFSSAETVVGTKEEITVNNIGLEIATSNSVIFYMEIPDYEKANADWGLALAGNGITLNQGSDISSGIKSVANGFSYLNAGSSGWVVSDIDANGHLLLPSGFKGYIRLDFKKIFPEQISFGSSYKLTGLSLSLNAVGGKSGSALFGGVFYVPDAVNDSTVMSVNGIPFQLAVNKTTTVDPKPSYNSENSFKIDYSGTNSEVTAKYVEAKTSALWAEKASGITSISGKALTTKGYMNSYVISNPEITMQPAVDSFMIYVELPKHKKTTCALKLAKAEIQQSAYTEQISFSNSIYEYMNVDGGVWKIARAGAEGELNALPSGFRGYVRFDLKKFKGFISVNNIDFTKPYKLSRLELSLNHFGGENGNIVIGNLYSVLEKGNNEIFKHSFTGKQLYAMSIGGDIDCNGKVTENDIKNMRKALLGIETLDATEQIRADKISSNDSMDISSLLKMKLLVNGKLEPGDVYDSSETTVRENIFSQNVAVTEDRIIYEREDVTNYSAIIEADTALNTADKAIAFSNEINNGKITDFEKIGIDKMCHVSTFLYANGNIYVSYYANTVSAQENPAYQVARLAYCPEDNPDDKVILDIQLVGDEICGYKVTGVYDTILMQKDDEPNNLYILWTASINGNYYRFYRIFDMQNETLGEIQVNRFKVGNIVNDFSSTGMTSALIQNKIGYKTFFTDIGIMQKLSSRIENGVKYYYTGAYSGNFTCIIKSRDLITWEYVAQPNEGANSTGFANQTKWENAVYVLNDKVYYFVRQWDEKDGGSKYGILTYYDLITGEWATPVLVGDCQSRSDFIYYQGGLYLFYAPTDREHIGILKINTDDLSKTEVVLQADMNGSCFYPFVQYTSDGELAMSYTVSREHIRLAKFTLSNYI